MTGYVATIGMFDGVHLGHQFVLRHVVDTARETGLQSMAITFDQTMRRDQVLTSLSAKRLLLSKTGVNRIEVLQFTDELRQMTAREFMERVLKEQLNVKILLTGYDNRFGHDRKEGFADYVKYGQELGIEVRALPPAPSNGMGMGEGPTISSSYIRRLLADGHVGKASEGLGYPYTILGRVEHGEHIGTKLGFPTANLVPVDKNQLIPAAGAYAVKVRMENSVEWKHGMMNIGMRPTFDGHQQTLEVHIFRLSENLYGQQLLVSFIERLREEQRFESIEALIGQLQQDAVLAEQILNQDIDEI
ncbi:MAG: riboflavin biosynthesis protein RibF [Prevotella sp.]|nr:riboflavin biosynthesis protein RibF [Prevotella sp.]